MTNIQHSNIDRKAEQNFQHPEQIPDSLRNHQMFRTYLARYGARGRHLWTDDST